MCKYLNATTGECRELMAEDMPAGWVGVPAGAEVATVRGVGIVDFWRDNGQQRHTLANGWKCITWGLDHFIRDTGARILWTRDEAVPVGPWRDEDATPEPDDVGAGPGQDIYDALDPWRTQVGGDHYRKLAIQPMQYSLANGLDAGQHTVIKYVTRFKDKDGLEGLLKARQTIDLMIAHYYPGAK